MSAWPDCSLQRPDKEGMGEGGDFWTGQAKKPRGNLGSGDKSKDSLGSEAKPMSSSDNVVSAASCSDDGDLSAPLTGTYNDSWDGGA